MMRLFVAIPLPGAIRSELRALGCDLPGARWLDEDQLRLTLLFLGDVRRTQRDALDRALGDVSAPAIPLSLAGMGHFPSRGRPRVLWAGVRAPPDLHALQADLLRTLRAAGFPLPRRRYHPHVTIARLSRLVRTERVAQYLGECGSFKGRPFVARGFELYQSVLRPEGAEYRMQRSYGPGMSEAGFGSGG